MNYVIPEMDDTELRERADAIKPLVRNEGVLHYMQEPSCLRSVSFLWDPKLLEPASDDLCVVGEVKTLHTYGYYGFFKPSIFEVLAQIPEDMLPKVKAFELVGPVSATDLNDNFDELNEGFHVGKAILYG